ncbi:MAG: hypothetical protein H6817_04725 [Phycisphaerales bacterium]|nr:hypothetical protein [Phycisphaerales bacterium]
MQGRTVASVTAALFLTLSVAATARAVDSDGDGVDNAIDVCCDTPPGTLVDATGRPIGDFDLDCDNDLADFAIYEQGFTGPLVSVGACACTFHSQCDDGNACTADFCNSGTCQHIPTGEGGGCDDGDTCTVNDACSNGACIGEAVPGCVSCTMDSECDDGYPCTVDTCNLTTFVCEYSDSMSGLSCDDGDACTTADVCDGSGGCAGIPTDCSGLDSVCTMGACNATTGACEVVPASNGAACDDGNPCTVGDVCVAGTCTSTPLNCDDGNPCTADACVAGACQQTPLTGNACTDGDSCTVSDVCDAGGSCTGIPVDCSGLDTQCTVGVCFSGIGCQSSPLPDGLGCDDGIAATINDQCMAGVCTGTTP